MIYIIFKAIYIASIIATYSYVRIAKSETGIWKGLKFNMLDIMIILLPIVNTITAIMWYSIHLPKR